MMKRLIVGLAAVVVLVGVGQVEASIIMFTYSGTFDRAAADHAGIQGAGFTVTAVFPYSAYVDNGSGQPSLAATSTTFTISGAPLPGSNGEYIAERALVMFPALGGESQRVKFVHEITGWTTGPRLIPNFENLYGGDGLGATIGQMPSVSHFPTSISDPWMLALPHNIPYDVTSPSITTTVIPGPFKPIAHADGPYYGLSGGTVILDGTASCDFDGDPLSQWQWDIEFDGSVEYTTPTADFTIPSVWAMGSVHPVGLRVYAGNEWSDWDTSAISVIPGPSSVIPEPSTIIIWSLLGGLGISVGWWRRRKLS